MVKDIKDEPAQEEDSRSPQVVDRQPIIHEPPPETVASVWTRRYIVLSFWLIVILLGLPLWWTTTMVYRANLPLDAMTAWAAGSRCSPTFSLRVEIVSADMGEAELATLVKDIQAIFDQSDTQTAHQIRFWSHSKNREAGRTASALKVAISSRKTSASPLVNLHLYSSEPILDIQFDPSDSSTRSRVVAESVNGLFAEEKAMIAHLFSTSTGVGVPSSSQSVSAQMVDSFEKRRTRSVKYASTYHLTFSLFTPEATPSDWDIKAALHKTIEPLLRGLSPISNFTIDTQVQPYATFSPSVRPFFDEQRKAWLLKSSDLGGFINAAEWPLSPSIGAGPTINFVLYVPSASQTPMLIDDGGSTSWLILQWGGIAIFNPPDPKALEEAGRLPKEELIEPFLTFSQHLLDLLGLPSPDLPFQMRLSSQMRILALRLISSASSTLGSLARLVQELPSISIPKSTAESVESTLAHLEASCAALNGGRFQEALSHAITADEEAEKAFFHKSMVGQVYFPDEHKVAVYLPMLGPMAVPLIMSILREIKSFRAKKQ